MKRISVAQGLVRKMKNRSAVSFALESDYSRANAAVQSNLANAALIEVTESKEYDADYCLALCSDIRRSVPECKLLLMCPDNNAAAMAALKEAKENWLIDKIVSYSVSLDELANIIISL